MAGRKAVPDRPNILFVLADQLRASALPLYGETQIETPNIDRLAGQGTVFTQAVSTCPVCTPYRAMLLTGRHPQTTGHVINFVRTRHDEISIADAFSRAGYGTGWVGKWHLHTGSFPQIEGPDYVPQGRDRLGFEFWRGYNFHCSYFDGWVNVGDWRNDRWQGYETSALGRYAMEFMDAVGGRPFCLFVSPHQPHFTGASDFAPAACYERLPQKLELPGNVPESMRDPCRQAYRHYLAMTLALDDMVGELMQYLERAGRAENTLLVFTSDHGTQGGAQGIPFWRKLSPYEESLKVPLVMRLPGVFEHGRTCDALTAAVDLFPSLCRLCDVPVPRTVEGRDLSDAWRGRPAAAEQDALLTMNFTNTYDYLQDGAEWRGVRTKRYSYARWLNGKAALYDLQEDPLQMRNMAGSPQAACVQADLERRLKELMAQRHDVLAPCAETYGPWFDSQRRIIRNAAGPLPDPEQAPDWSLLT